MIAARLAAGDQNNYVKAISLLFSPIDVYKDTIFPGGLPCTGFMNHYREFTYYGERNKTVHHVPMPLLLRVMNLVLLDGAAPVDDDKYCVQLNEAIKEHEMNWDMNETLKDIACYDDIVTASNGRKYTADKVGVTTEVINNISKNNVAVYSFAGYYDSGSIRSATRVFCGVSRRDGTDDNNKSTNPADTVGIPSVGNSRNKLTIGPWNHGARNNGSSYSSTTVPAYDTMYDLKRFFDAHLCNIHENNGILDEPPVHYFELGSESWVTSDRWPVAPEEWIEFSMNINGQLTFSEEGNYSNALITIV